MDDLRPNAPPGVDLEYLRASLPEQTADLEARAAALIEEAGRVPERIEDDETAAEVGRVMKRLTLCARDVERRRKDAKQPYLDAGRTIDDHFVVLPRALARAKAEIAPRVGAYLTAKREREERECAEREARERAEREERGRVAAEAGPTDFGAAREASRRSAPAPVRPTGSVTDDYGVTTSLRATWVVEIVDWPAFRASPQGQTVLDSERVRAAVQAELEAEVRSGWRRVAGVQITERTSAVAR